MIMWHSAVNQTILGVKITLFNSWLLFTPNPHEMTILVGGGGGGVGGGGGGGGGGGDFEVNFDQFEVNFWWKLLHLCMEVISFAYRFASIEKLTEIYKISAPGVTLQFWHISFRPILLLYDTKLLFLCIRIITLEETGLAALVTSP